MGLFSRKPTVPSLPPLPSYVGVPLEARLADPVWSEPIAQAGFDPTTADFIRVVGEVTVTTPLTFNSASGATVVNSDSMTYIGSSETGVLIFQGNRVGIAVPDANIRMGGGGRPKPPTRIAVISYPTRGAVLNIGNVGWLKLVWMTPEPYGIVFVNTNYDGEDRAFGEELRRLIQNR